MRESLAHGAAAHSEVLREDINRALIDGGITGDYASTFLVLANQRKQLHKAACIGQLFHTLASGQLASVTLFLEALFAAIQNGLAQIQHLLKVL